MSELAPVPVDPLREFCVEALSRCGVSPSSAGITADVLVTADTWGVFTHGTKLLAGYVPRLRAGGLVADASPEIVGEGASWAVVDGGSGLGHVTTTFAMGKAIEKARTTGSSMVGVRNSNHFGPAGYYAVLAARQGMIGVAMANDVPSVAAPGSRTAVLGSNPIAYAIPTGTDDPVLLDMATSTVAGGKVFAAHQRGEVLGPITKHR